MSIALAVVLLVAPVTEANRAPLLEPGIYPAGVILHAIARASERPIYFDGPGLGNARIELDRRLIVARGHLAAMQSLLHDAGVSVRDLEPESAVRSAWIARAKTEGARRPIRLQVRVIRLEHAPVEEVAARLNALAEERERLLPPGDVPTKFTPDPRTGSLIARYTSEERLADYLARLGELDRPAPSGEKTLVMRTFRPRAVHARHLLPLFEAEWDRSGGHPIRAAVPADQNVIIVRCSLRTWEAVEPILRSLDHRS
ncbi:MAG: secretin N-terminal domain-containing protein [Planctomycetota bacterium]|jgi:hypothetical protein